MLILRPRDETYVELVLVARALSQPNFVTFIIVSLLTRQCTLWVQYNWARVGFG